MTHPHQKKYQTSEKGLETYRRYRNRPEVKAKQRAFYAERRAMLDAIKVQSGCVDCGYKDHPAALDFDHKDGVDKRYNIAAIPMYRWETIEAEIAKCEVRCANCHRIRSFGP